MNEIPSRYDPKSVEENIFLAWDKEKLFHADENTKKTPYTIVIPPPNVTGVLHMGHALNNTIQDILVRWKRMQGYEALWVPGTDHAGIATQNVVERALAKEGRKRTDLGREKFVERVWRWKEEYGSTIIKQLRRLGSSCDWDRTRFTMDEGLSRAVKEVFIRLYNEGLIYKDDYTINWCPRCGTALSDEEASHNEVEGALYYIKYPVKGHEKLETEGEDHVVVATTRPETLLGDAAVCVNPRDPRYQGLRGKKLLLPILKRELEIIFDEHVDMEFGTGALKVTPAHDHADFELGIKHGLDRINMMNPDGTINEIGGDYSGMDRFECRETIVEDLRQRKLLVKIDKHTHSVGHCYRCNTIVEPRLSKQWFVKMKPLAKEAIEVVRDGRIKFYPARWTKVYLNWMENIRDWCISRQIWWGHRIPVWYCKDCLKYTYTGEVSVNDPGADGVMVASGEAPSKCSACGGANIEQDPDVLDTWFSSWLWPVSTLGWPDETKELKLFYPTDALVTAQEIIFFWVARMIMAGLKLKGEVPFRDVYIHGTVRDETGTKMSKSLGNVIDPLEIIEEYGTDALRFSMISITSQGQDVFLSKDKFEFGRNFANKLWNASRYVLMNLDEATLKQEIDRRSLGLADRWILSAFNETIQKVNTDLASYRFNEAAQDIYEFVWHKYCDWYLELAKLSDNKEVTQTVFYVVLKGVLKLLHPFMPFITEEIWKNLPGKKDHKYIMASEWPGCDESLFDETATEEVETMIKIVAAIRNIRAFWNVGVKFNLEVDICFEDGRAANMIKHASHYIERMARCQIRNTGKDLKRPEASVAAAVDKIKLYVPIGGAIDVDKEKARITLKVEELENYLISIEKKLSSRSFADRAPQDIVQKEKEKQAKFGSDLVILKENLQALG